MDIRYDLENKFKLNFDQVDINENIYANELVADDAQNVIDQHITEKGDDSSLDITIIMPEKEICTNICEI